MYNVVNPDDICARYGADTLRMYEMFLGPLEQSKPWDTNGIDGVHRFLKKFWKLFFDKDGNFMVTKEASNAQEKKVLHQLIKKVETDIEQFSFNTTISAFMIGVNELTNLKCNKREVLEPLVVLISPFAPHIAEELWSLLGNPPSVAHAGFPVYNPEFTREQVFEYPVSFNGKLRFKISLGVDLTKEAIEQAVLADERTGTYTGKEKIKRVVVVPGKIINNCCMKIVKEYLLITLGILIYVASWSTFIIPNHLVGGGVAGISTLIFYATNLPISVSFFAFNIVLIIIGLRTIGWKFGIKTIFGVTVTTLHLCFASGNTTDLSRPWLWTTGS